MNNINRLKDQQRDKHPGFDLYMNCMTRALFGGLATFCLTFSGFYFTQKVIQRKVRYPIRVNVLISALSACGASYYATRRSTLDCQAAWMAAEDKHTALKEPNF